MGKQSSKALKPHEIEAMARQQNRMNNPNQSNIFGSTTTTFGPDDQANIVQTLSPEMEAIIGSQMDFVSQGPAQMGEYSNPFYQSMMGSVANRIGERSGFQAPSADNMGGFNSTMPQFNQGGQDPMQPDPMSPMNIPQGMGPQAPQPTAQSAPAQPQRSEMFGGIGEALGNAANGNASQQMGMELGRLLRDFKKPDSTDFMGR